jgi:hypothetical protein
MAARLFQALLVLALASSHACGAERRLLEAEDFEGGTLPCTPYFREDAKGWYAREAICRAYGAAWGRLPTTIRLSRPVENATYTVWVVDDAGAEQWLYNTCWLTVVPRVGGSIDGRLDEWSSVHPAWMYYTYAWGRLGRHTSQFERNGEHFQYVHRIDARAAIYCGYQDGSLHVAIKCEDDDPVFSGPECDTLELHLNPAPGENRGTRVLTLRPNGERVDVSASGGLDSDGIACAMARGQARKEYGAYRTWTVETKLPLASIGAEAKPGHAVGFDVVWHDADHDGDAVVTGTWRWAGRSSTLGTLFFGQ